MLQYIVGSKINGGVEPVVKKNNLKRAGIVLFFLLLIVGWFVAGATVMVNWHNGDVYCNDRFKFPFHISLMYMYLGFILWFSQFPTKEYEWYQNVFG